MFYFSHEAIILYIDFSLEKFQNVHKSKQADSKNAGEVACSLLTKHNRIKKP